MHLKKKTSWKIKKNPHFVKKIFLKLSNLKKKIFVKKRHLKKKDILKKDNSSFVICKFPGFWIKCFYTSTVCHFWTVWARELRMGSFSLYFRLFSRSHQFWICSKFWSGFNLNRLENRGSHYELFQAHHWSYYRVIDIFVSEEIKKIYRKDNFNTINYIPMQRKLIAVFDYDKQKINK